MKADIQSVSTPGLFCSSVKGGPGDSARINQSKAAMRRAFRWATDEEISPDKKDRAAAWFNFASFQRDVDSDPYRAIQSLETCSSLENYGGEALTHYELGNVYMSRGKWPSARKHYRQALSMRYQPRFELENAIAQCFMRELSAPKNYYNEPPKGAVRERYIKEARTAFDEAARGADSHGGLVYYNKGVFEMKMNEPARAAQCFRAAAVGHHQGDKPNDPGVAHWEPHEPAEDALSKILNDPQHVSIKHQFARDQELHEAQRHTHDLHRAKTRQKVAAHHSYEAKLREHAVENLVANMGESLARRRVANAAFEEHTKGFSEPAKRGWKALKKGVDTQAARAASDKFLQQHAGAIGVVEKEIRVASIRKKIGKVTNKLALLRMMGSPPNVPPRALETQRTYAHPCNIQSSLDQTDDRNGLSSPG